MPLRKIPFVTNDYYHVFNRGVARLPTYTHQSDYERFILTIQYYRYSTPPCKLSRYLQLQNEIRQQIHISLTKENNVNVEIICYALMPNHFHLLLKQTKEHGISGFIMHLLNSYTKYFNTKYDRVGPLYQGTFKAVVVESDEQLLHISRYIHLNPLVSNIISEKNFLLYKWSSLQYFTNTACNWINAKPILDFFLSKEDYIKFILDHADYARQLELVKHLALEK